MTDEQATPPDPTPPPSPRAQPVLGGFTRGQVQLLLIGAVAMVLPLCLILIIFTINFGGPQ